MESGFAEFSRRLGDCIGRTMLASGEAPIGPGASDEFDFNRLALDLFRLQFEHVAPYRRHCEARGRTPEQVENWRQIPAVPTAAFRDLEFTSLLPGQRTRVFHSSGTTAQRPSRHFHDEGSLRLYEQSSLPWFETHVLPAVQDRIAPTPRLLFLTPDPGQVPHSSLAHMFGTVQRAFPELAAEFLGGLDAGGAWTVDLARTVERLESATNDPQPLALAATAFAFVHLLDHLSERGRRYALAPGSRVMETGGYKGRSRSLPKPQLHALLHRWLGVSGDSIVSEYGMAELSSQAYDHMAGQPCPATGRRFRFPPWARALTISPETGEEVADGETGLLHVFDLVNVRSVMAVQTEDVVACHGGGFELRGRASHATARGCSLLSA